MFRCRAAAFLTLSLLSGIVSAADRPDAPAGNPRTDWPQWRGPLGTGVAPAADPPREWDGASGKNVRWKTELPGRGHSTPIVHGDRVYLTAAIPFGDRLPPRHTQAPGAHDNIPVTQRQRFVALALDRADGRILWQRTLREALPHDGGGHATGSLASHSPATDGERVYVFFGSQGLYALDRDGERQWHVEFQPMQPLHGHGEGSSLALFGGTVVVNCDHEGESFVAAFDARSGVERWRVRRPEPTSWSSPIVVELDGRPQVIVNGTQRMRGYDLANGDVLWECGGLSSNIVASPVFHDGMVFAGSSYEKRIVLGIDLDGAAGDLTGTRRVAWSRGRSSPYVPSLLLYDDALYYLGHYQGVLSRVHARSGADQPGTTRLAGIGDVYASPVGAAGRVYITDREGVTLVLRHADPPRVLAENRLEERVNASAAIAGKELFLRGERFLYCLAEVADATPGESPLSDGAP